LQKPKIAIGTIVLTALLSVAAFCGGDADNALTGFYLIRGQADSANGVANTSAGFRVVRYDYRFLQETERETPVYLLLAKIPDVPLVLATTPELHQKGQNGFPELRLELTPEAATKLETLTREHLGQMVTFAIDGEPVTIHKIKTVITGGQFQLTRCTDTACQYIYGRLLAK
jgi:preprotein translocase subunit SecD